jgi:hypothetical protein
LTRVRAVILESVLSPAPQCNLISVTSASRIARAVPQLPAPITVTFFMLAFLPYPGFGPCISRRLNVVLVAVDHQDGQEKGEENDDESFLGIKKHGHEGNKYGRGERAQGYDAG